MADLFKRTGLEQDTGLLRERWDQEGSESMSATGSVTTTASPTTLLTVTAGYVFYCKAIVVNSDEAAGTPAGVTIRDDTTNKMTIYVDKTYGSLIPNLPSPIKFETDVNILSVSNNDTNVTVIGWEERA